MEELKSQQNILKHIGRQSGYVVKEAPITYFQKMSVCLWQGTENTTAQTVLTNDIDFKIETSNKLYPFFQIVVSNIQY